MATSELVVTSVIEAVGSWTGATVANLEASDDLRATGGAKNDTIKAEITNAPGDFGSQNSVILKVEARASGTTSRDRQVQVDLLNSADTVLETLTSDVLTTTDTTSTSATFTRSDSQATIDGYRLLLTVIEGGGMGDTESVEVDFASVMLDYNISSLTADLAATLPALTASFDVDVVVAGDLAANLPGLTAAFDAGVTVQGDLAATLPSLTASFDVTASNERTVDLAATLPGLTAAFDAGVIVAGDLGAALPLLTGAFDADVVVAGDLAGTFPALMASMDAGVLVAGEFAVTVPALTGSFDIGEEASNGVEALPRARGRIWRRMALFQWRQ